jgi:hypothetical protein
MSNRRSGFDWEQELASALEVVLAQVMGNQWEHVLGIESAGVLDFGSACVLEPVLACGSEYALVCVLEHRKARRWSVVRLWEHRSDEQLALESEDPSDAWSGPLSAALWEALSAAMWAKESAQE